jgi:hypothetical protein
MNTPVALIIFNRPDTTERVFTEIAKAKPPKLFVIADGPRTDHPDDVKRCAATRAVVEHIDWDCEVFRNYSDVNLGCGYRPASGISWVFEQVDEAIILEDDCVPHPTFFRFCEELLEKYRHDERIMQISGFNSLSGRSLTPYSYTFYRLFACWGWATWRRAWQYHDMEMKFWPLLRDTAWLLDIIGDHGAQGNWKKIFDDAHNRAASIDYWDYQFLFACWAQNGLAISPATSLVSNIGFREDASHTKSANSACATIPVVEMKFPLRHPQYVVRDREADQLHFGQMNVGQRTMISYRRFQKKLIDIIYGIR